MEGEIPVDSSGVLDQYTCILSNLISDFLMMLQKFGMNCLIIHAKPLLIPHSERN